MELEPRGGKSLTHVAPLELSTSSPQFHIVAKSHLCSSVRPPSTHPSRSQLPLKESFIVYHLPLFTPYLDGVFHSRHYLTQPSA